MTRTGRAAAILAVVVSTSLVLAGCTGDNDDPPPSPTAGGSSTPSASVQSMTRAELEESVFAGASGEREVLGSADGAVPDPSTPYPARIDVTAVVADASSTIVQFTLVNTQDTDPLLQFSAFNALHPLFSDIRDIAIVDPGAEQRLQPYIGQLPGKELDLCSCSYSPLQMSSAGQLLSGIFPPLDPSSTTVTVEIPGFPPVEDVPVTRR